MELYEYVMKSFERQWDIIPQYCKQYSCLILRVIYHDWSKTTQKKQAGNYRSR